MEVANTPVSTTATSVQLAAVWMATVSVKMDARATSSIAVICGTDEEVVSNVVAATVGRLSATANLVTDWQMINDLA